MQTPEFVVACHFEPCANGGTCVDDECVCADGYDGILCRNSTLPRQDLLSYAF